MSSLAIRGAIGWVGCALFLGLCAYGAAVQHRWLEFGSTACLTLAATVQAVEMLRLGAERRP